MKYKIFEYDPYSSCRKSKYIRTFKNISDARAFIDSLNDFDNESEYRIKICDGYMQPISTAKKNNPQWWKKQTVKKIILMKKWNVI